MSVKVDQLVSHHYAKTGNTCLHYVSAGECQGTPIVLLHGFPDFWYGWRRQVPALVEAGFWVVAPDLRGYNLSSKPRGVWNYTLDRLSDDIRALINHLRVDKAHLVGHDWGGIIAWHLAMKQPQYVERLAILNAPHPAAFFRELRRPQQMLRSSYVGFFQLPRIPEWLIRRHDYALLRAVYATDPKRRGAYKRRDIERSVEAMSLPGTLTASINYYRALVQRPQRMLRSVRPIEQPVLVLWGEQDRYLVPQMLDGLEQWAPNLQIERFPEASHWVQHDAAEQVNEHLVRFFGN
jgi:pimeloyl-ACP methyl ester carboxylesterase